MAMPATSIAPPVSTCGDTCGAANFVADAPPVPVGSTVGLAVLKLPRVGSTWLKAEMNRPVGGSQSALWPSKRARSRTLTVSLRARPTRPLLARRLPGVHLEFEPLTDGKHREAWCGSNFTNALLARMLVQPQHCVNRKMINDPCVWTKQGCDADRIYPKTIKNVTTLEAPHRA